MVTVVLARMSESEQPLRLERQMTHPVVSSVCPVALRLVHLVHRHAFPHHVGGLRRFCSLGGGGAGLLGGGGASDWLARSTATALLLLLSPACFSGLVL